MLKLFVEAKARRRAIIAETDRPKLSAAVTTSFERSNRGHTVRRVRVHNGISALGRTQLLDQAAISISSGRRSPKTASEKVARFLKKRLELIARLLSVRVPADKKAHSERILRAVFSRNTLSRKRKRALKMPSVEGDCEALRALYVNTAIP